MIHATIAAAFRRAIDKCAELLLGPAAHAAIGSQPGEDIRVLLGHDGRPAGRATAMLPGTRLEIAKGRLYTIPARAGSPRTPAAGAGHGLGRPVLH